MTKQNKSILSALALVVIFAAWLILQRTGAGGGTPAPVLDSQGPLEDQPRGKNQDQRKR